MFILDALALVAMLWVWWWFSRAVGRTKDRYVAYKDTINPNSRMARLRAMSEPKPLRANVKVEKIKPQKIDSPEVLEQDKLLEDEWR